MRSAYVPSAGSCGLFRWYSFTVAGNGGIGVRLYVRCAQIEIAQVTDYTEMGDLAIGILRFTDLARACALGMIGRRNTKLETNPNVNVQKT